MEKVLDTPVLESHDETSLRVMNRNFSLGEYDDSWGKLERYLFIEIYEVIKDFYLSKSDENIITFSEESIFLYLPVDRLDRNFFEGNQLSRDLMNASAKLSKKQINIKTLDEESGQWGFSFVSMFPEMTYNPKQDKKRMKVRVPAKIFDEMVPIESYCMLELKLLGKFNSGNTIRLYEIIMSLAFKKNFSFTFNELRKKLGHYSKNKYPLWKHFNLNVLKPAVMEINKSGDIRVDYTKRRGKDEIFFSVTQTEEGRNKPIKILSLNEKIANRSLNLIQAKYLETTLNNLKKKKLVSDVNEVRSWIISDLIGLQSKQGMAFNFKASMRGISKQIRKGEYRKPFVHKYVCDDKEITFSDEIYNDLKEMERKGEIEEILKKYSEDVLKAHHHAHLLDIARSGD